ncbi:MAG: LLM class flavin-dependent oxidoreductase [Alphaproteobacteria bacterium]|jgi:probable F420-dependent oxidoreductase|nr:LLM class flavin-dependent oxidoreductase [Alphaproteobacteria bacterium]
MGVAVGLGIADFPFSDAAAYWRWVALCETGGIDSIWQTDRLVSHQPFLECMTTMAALAGATKRLKFGMNVVSVGLRDPLLLAKECATIDFLSGGRLLPAFGIGTRTAPGWKATGRPTKGRGKRTDEGLEIIARLWTGEAVTFEGDYYHYDKAQIAPLPANKRIPLWIGGASEAAIRRTGRFGTGWQGAFEPPEEVPGVIARIHAAAAEFERRIPYDHFGAAMAFRFGDWSDPPARKAADAFQGRFARDPKRHMAVGQAGDIIRRLEAFFEAGVHKFILRPIADDDEDILDQTQRFIDEVHPWIAEADAKSRAMEPG